jgi:hypothetical protein
MCCDENIEAARLQHFRSPCFCQSLLNCAGGCKSLGDRQTRRRLSVGIVPIFACFGDGSRDLAAAGSCRKRRTISATLALLGDRARAIADTVAVLHAPLHRNCYLSPTDFTSRFAAAANPAAADQCGKSRSQWSSYWSASGATRTCSAALRNSAY